MSPDPLGSAFFYPQLLGFFVALLACALFSFLETAITALRLFKLKEIATTSPRYQELFKTLEERPQQVLVTILIGSNLADVTAAALITNIMETLFEQLQLSGGLGFSVGIGVATTAILIFGEVIPKNLAKIHGERLFRSTLWFTNVVYYTLYPVVNFLMRLSAWVLSIFGGPTEPTESMVTEREIRFLIDYINEKGLMEREKTEMLQSIFKLGSKQVKEIMVPAIDIVMLDARATLKESFEVFSKYQLSRLPVFKETKDNIIGMVLQKDIFLLMSQQQEKPLEELVRPILFIPESLKINQLLRELRLKHIHIAIVLNEYGSITGLVTLEDVLEEIVGEIRDEYENVPEKIVPLHDGGWLIDGSVTLETLSKLLNINFEVVTAVTIGGFLTEQLQHLPKTGERIVYKEYGFHVQQASAKRVLQVRIFKGTDHAPE
ncbi:MAG: hemolysin family protein [Candidatus Babeliales bacterium]